MTLVREGWVVSSGRRGEILRGPENELVKVVCEGCGGELQDIDVFEAHECENYRSGPEFDVTSAAEELAEDEGVDLSEVEGSGQGGRITKADVESAAGGS